MLYLGFFLLLTSTAWAVNVTESDVTFLVYTYPDYTNTFFNYTLGNSTCDLPIDLSKKMIIYVHGWEDVFKDAEYYLMQALVETQNDSIIVRMEYPYQPSYLAAVSTVTSYGTYVANFLLCLNSTYGYPLDNIRVIGHSLGAHIAGTIGRVCGGMLPFVMGLDPAAPVFDEDSAIRFRANDAVSTSALHTSDTEGTPFPNAIFDAFVNGGILQPGCGSVLNVTCNHVAAITIYAQSLYNLTLQAVQCASYTIFLSGACDDNDVAYVGGITPDPTARGKYYVNTT